MLTEVVMETDLPLPVFNRGKVRDTYDLGDRLLMVATDRISAFDCILQDGIPGKGRVLTELSAFWFGYTNELLPNHLISTDMIDLPDSLQSHRAQLEGRSMIVRKARRLDVECVVRGYLAGSGWLEYKEHQSICGVPLPSGLREADELPEPIFTPTTKAREGHDLPITLAEVKTLVGEDMGQAMRDASIAVYRAAAAYAQSRGIIIADTKMEFGVWNEQLILIDELLTPDSSRFWMVGNYQPGTAPRSYDKQNVRDWLLRSGWNKQPPPPHLPAELIADTSTRYRQALEWLTGQAAG